MLASTVFGCLVLFAAAGVVPVEVRGVTNCPTAAQVKAALVGLIAPPHSTAGVDVVQLSADGGSVNLKLTKASGETVAEKRLPESLSCAERARTAAVMVAAWEARLRAGTQPPLTIATSTPTSPSTSPAPIAAAASTPTPTATPTATPAALPTATAIAAPTPTPTPIAVAVPTPTPAPVAAPPPIPAKVEAKAASPIAANETNTLTAHAQTPSASPIEIETSAAVLASVAAGTVAPAAMLQASFARRDSRFGFGIGGLAVGTHTASVGSGQGAWRRFGGVVDLRSISRWRRVQMELHAGLALTALMISGQSFPVTSNATIFDPGVIAGLRSGFPLGRLSPWVEVAAAFWPRTHNVYVDGTASSSDLPPFEVLLGLGVSLGPDW